MSNLADKLTKKGVRLTRQRRLLLDIIEKSRSHLQARDILRLAKKKDPRINRATVYRTLLLLKDEGLVDELDLLHLDGSEHHYEIKSNEDHVHIGCRGCGLLTEFESYLVRQLELSVERRIGWEVESVRIEIAARCPECREKD